MKITAIQHWFKQLVTLFAFAFFASIAFADPMIGKDFLKTAQILPVENKDKIEVVEIFWYGCPHCYQMDPLLETWLTTKADDVEFKRIPGLPHAAWEPMAKAYYAMQDLGVLEKYHAALFEAIHGQNGYKKIATNEKAAIAWLSTISGIDTAQVEAAFNSFSMRNRLAQAANYFRASGATGVPSLVVDGRFITSGPISGDNETAIKVTDYIIENIRADRAAGK